MADTMMLSDKRILLIIGGGIAAYKSLDLIRRLRERGAAVRVIMTAGAQEFITALAAGATPLVGAMLLLELAWGLVQGIAVITARRARQADEPKLVVSSHAHR